MNFEYNNTDRGRSVAFVSDGKLFLADETHPNFPEILRRLHLGLNPAHLFDLVTSIRNAIRTYSSRVTVTNAGVMVDGTVVTGMLSEKILSIMSDGNSPRPYVKFLENIWDNPSHRSREQLFSYIERHGFLITDDGCFISYKGISNGKSLAGGTAFVDGVMVKGKIPNRVGSVITMPRHQVSDDPNVACHQGLHAGAWAYANMWGDDVVKVKINPANVVSVPADSSQQKLRTCEYEVLSVTKRELDYSGHYYAYTAEDMRNAHSAGLRNEDY
jgi:hypothetical protein